MVPVGASGVGATGVGGMVVGVVNVRLALVT